MPNDHDLAVAAGEGARRSKEREIVLHHAQAHDMLDGYGIPRFEERGIVSTRMHELDLPTRLQRFIDRVTATVTPTDGAKAYGHHLKDLVIPGKGYDGWRGEAKHHAQALCSAMFTREIKPGTGGELWIDEARATIAQADREWDAERNLQPETRD